MRKQKGNLITVDIVCSKAVCIRLKKEFNMRSNGVSAVLWYTSKKIEKKHFRLANLDRQKLDLLLRSGLQTCLLHSSKDPQKLIKLRRFFSEDQQVVPFSISNCVSTAVTHQQLKQIHSLIITSGLHQSVFFSGKLISKYSQFQNPNASRLVFRQTSHPNNIFLWNSIIRALTQNGMFLEALEVFSEMRKLKLRPDSFTLPSVINACAGSSNIEMGRVVHDCVLEMGFSSDLFIGNSLIDMYSRFGCLDEARNVFERIPTKDPVSWNSLISGYCANGEWSQAIDFYYQSRVLGMIPDSFTVSSVLPAFGNKFAINEGKMIHGLIHKIGVENDRLVNNGLLSMYCKCEALADAQRVFDVMEQRDTVSWNTVICGYSQMGLFPEAVKLFQKMIMKFKPDLLTVTSVLRACGHMKDLEFGKSVHKYMNMNGYEYDTMASNILITMYARCGDLKSSRKVFDGMVCRDSVSWNSMVNGYIQNELYNEGMELFNMMKESELKPDSVTHVLLLSMCSEIVDLIQGKKLHCSIIKMGFHSYLPVANTVVDMYAKCGSLEDALKEFEEIKARDVVSWNSIITGCVHSGDCNLGLKIVSQMRAEGLIPDVATLLGILPACSFLASKRRGKEIHGYILKFGFESELPIGNALIEMYSKCGSLENALRVFKCMEVRDVVTWTALVSAYGMYGEGKKALGAFSQMESRGIIPDHVSFVAVIYACSHSGLTEDGLGLFQRLKEKYNIEPTIEHYACVVDLLSRSGCFAEAEEFILAIPLKPDASIWGALLSSCRATGESQFAERISRRILELDSDDSGYHVLVSNVYAALGKWDKVGKIRKSLRGKGLKKNPGCSWIEIGNRVYAFGTGDRFVEQSEEVYRLLERLTGLMAKEGYIADQKFVLHDVEEDEKIDMLCGHSERLAIAFGLLNTSPGTALQIMKNLRVCGDCHTVIKYISKILQRELLVRDANRFHLFKDGACSCGDFW